MTSHPTGCFKNQLESLAQDALLRRTYLIVLEQGDLWGFRTYVSNESINSLDPFKTS
jgi:hypothetical protein